MEPQGQITHPRALHMCRLGMGLVDEGEILSFYAVCPLNVEYRPYTIFLVH